MRDFFINPNLPAERAAEAAGRVEPKTPEELDRDHLAADIDRAWRGFFPDNRNEVIAWANENLTVEQRRRLNSRLANSATRHDALAALKAAHSAATVEQPDPEGFGSVKEMVRAMADSTKRTGRHWSEDLTLMDKISKTPKHIRSGA